MASSQQCEGEAPGAAGRAHGDHVAAMRSILARTQCPFAAKARLWNAPALDRFRSVEENLRASLPALTRFTRVAEERRLDGFVYHFPVSYVGWSLEDLSRLVRVLVETLLEGDPVDPRPFRRAEVLDPRWRLTFSGVDYFAPVFAPIYGPWHSRFTYGATDGVFVLLQPNSSFHDHLGREPKRVREGIRRRFDQAGQAYPQYELEAHKFVLPCDAEDEPPRWYDLRLPARQRGPRTEGLSEVR